MIFATAFEIASVVMGFAADLITVVLGGIALAGIIRNRKELSAVVHAFANMYVNQRLNRLRETLGQLESYSYDTKEDQKEIRALIDQVCGQIGPLLDKIPELEGVHQRLLGVAGRKLRLTESLKRHIVHEIHGLIDSVPLDSRIQPRKQKP
jgi:hypothetical protein